MARRLLLTMAIWLCGLLMAHAQTVALPGTWLFAPDDRLAYREPDYDDHAWREIWGPAQLVDEGVELPDGVVWYRVHFDVPAFLVGKPMVLVLGKIDAADETFLNGAPVGHMGTFPPHVETAWSETRGYSVVPQAHNVLAVRVWRGASLGGITDGPIGLYTEADYEAAFYPPAAALRRCGNSSRPTVWRLRCTTRRTMRSDTSCRTCFNRSIMIIACMPCYDISG